MGARPGRNGCSPAAHDAPCLPAVMLDPPQRARLDEHEIAPDGRQRQGPEAKDQHAPQRDWQGARSKDACARHGEPAEGRRDQMA